MLPCFAEVCLGSLWNKSWNHCGGVWLVDLCKHRHKQQILKNIFMGRRECQQTEWTFSTLPWHKVAQSIKYKVPVFISCLVPGNYRPLRFSSLKSISSVLLRSNRWCFQCVLEFQWIPQAITCASKGRTRYKGNSSKWKLPWKPPKKTNEQQLWTLL